MNRQWMAWLWATGLALMLVTGCGSDNNDKSDNNDSNDETSDTDNSQGCEPGALDCACRVDGVCGLGEDGRQLQCVQGVCEEIECEEGADGCPCFRDLTCGDNLVCNGDALCEKAPPCTEGSVGCACKNDGSCAGTDALCEDGLCQRVDCPAGDEGCGCGPRNSCNTGADGAPLLCEGGLCRSAGCSPGESQCVCAQGTGCSSANDTCVQGHCIPQDCQAGEEGCLCAGGTCGPGLRCRAGVCLDNTGFTQGACFDDGSCARGNRCQREVCVTCSLGSQQCQCRDDNTCNTGLTCVEGTCEDTSGLATNAPKTLACYTPCTSGIELEDGRFLACPADGLMPGCFGDTTCVEGQCLREGASPATCASEFDCPDFQTCLAGHCASNCETADDCALGSTCHRRVCRQTCVVTDGEDVCGAGAFCELLDGENGVCRQSVTPTGTSQNNPIETFSTNIETVNLNNAAGEESFVLTNKSRSAVEFTLTRRSHLLFADGEQNEVVLEEGCEAPRCPMWWVQMRTSEGLSWQDPTQTFTLAGGASTTLTVGGGEGIDASRWQGDLEISTPNGGKKTLVISQSTSPKGEWAGEVYYFGSFKDVGVDAWVEDRDNPDRIEEMENAFLRLWSNHRQGRLSFEQFQAALVSTRTESWRSPRIYDLGCDPGSVCFPFTNFDGYLTYTSDPINVPVPSGVVEMPIALNIRPALDTESDRCDGEEHCFVGRIESTRALQYAGQPELSLSWSNSPETCSPGRHNGSCLTFLNSFSADLTVGARYSTDADDVSCGDIAGLEHVRTPWLLKGYKGRSEVDEETGRRYAYACRDTEAPLPGSNPVPDGRLRNRSIELVDGALINNNTLFVIFRERLDTFLWDTANDNNGIEGYGYMLLRKSEAEPSPDAYEGFAPPVRDNDTQLRNIVCTDEILAPMGLTRDQLVANSDINADLVAQVVVEGVTVDVSNLELLDSNTEALHYLCEDTGLLDGGPGDNRFNRLGNKLPCPEGSRVTFFTLALDNEDLPLPDNGCGNLDDIRDCHQAFVANLPCQESGTCQEQLNTWIDNHRHGIRTNPYFRCSDETRAFCSDDRHDLREGKVFFARSEESTVFQPILSEVADAFRYRTRFVNRSGVGVGFVPGLCIPGTDLVPYCYDPEAIENLRTRVECAMELYHDHYDNLSETHRFSLLGMLTENFSYAEEVNVFNEVSVRRGFEFLDTELLIMLGDDHYTRALASRFDLAQTQVASFEGDLFEENGINLSGVAGSEMHNLYASVQYYQMTLDRFYDLSPLIARSVRRARDENIPSYMTTAAVESYLGRLIRASTQKSKAWADIAERYQNFNRPDLARKVIERAYTATYLESMVLTSLMQDIVDITTPEDIAQIKQQVEVGQRSYRVAMAVMRQHYNNISDDINYFGFAPDFIPFPALEGLRDASFEVSLQRARARVGLAQTAELQALEADFSFNTNAASFQNELARIENTYDAQLSELCGTFEGDDGQIYPAIQKYAYLDEATRGVGDPCGLVGTGQLHLAMGQLDIVLTEMRRVRQAIKNTQEEAAIEERRWNAACNTTDAFARLQYRTSGEANSVQAGIDASRSLIGGIDRSIQDLSTLAMLSKCSLIVGVASGGDCPSAAIASVAYTAAFATYEFTRVAIDLEINAQEAEIRELQRGVEFERDLLQCDLTAIDGEARVATINLRLSEQSLEALKLEYEMNQTLSNIKQLRNQATRLQQEMAETEELAINIEAARNNPNVRIYRNDAILNADVTFYSALREVYKATRVFEYYTSQSYAPLEQLFLTRMVNRGDFNLQLYLIELEDAFRAFEDEYGLPARRLAILSLKNDVLQIPRIKIEGDNAAFTEAERTQMFRDKLTDVSNLDENGYITLPFSTSPDSLSPLTRNHKISFVEAEIIGGGQGDLLARIYLRMAGTSAVSSLGSGESVFYTFPERLVVINTFFEGSKPAHIDPEIYRNRQLFDRPFVNSRWEFVLNTLDEGVNLDLNLQGLDDIRLYVYYNDFTEF